MPIAISMATPIVLSKSCVANEIQKAHVHEVECLWNIYLKSQRQSNLIQLASLETPLILFEHFFSDDGRS